MVDVVISDAVLVVGGAVFGGGVGGAAGHLGVRLVRGLPRPVRPEPMWCPVGVAVLWAAVLARAATGALPLWWVPVPLLLGWLAVLLTACDLAAYRLPDALTLPAYPVTFAALGLAAGLGRSPGIVLTGLAGAVLFAGCYGAVRLVAGDGLGPGDVKLSGSLGAAVGAVSLAAVLLVMASAAVVTLVAGCLRRAAVPHGPAMLAPAWLVTAAPTWVSWSPSGFPALAAGAGT